MVGCSLRQNWLRFVLAMTCIGYSLSIRASEQAATSLDGFDDELHAAATVQLTNPSASEAAAAVSGSTAAGAAHPIILLAQATPPDEGADDDAAAAQARYDQAFEAMLADPTNTEKAFAFADAAVAVGDLYGAISALERILLVDPDRPDIQLRLGELYRQVGAAELAQLHLGEGITSRDIPEPIRRQAEILLESTRDQLALAESPHRFFGAINVGGRYETNANAGPDSNEIRVFGFEGPFLSDEDKEKDDFSALAVADLSYWYDFGTQPGDRLEADLLLLGTRYTDLSEVNTFLVDAELGPRFFLGEYIRDAGTQFLSVRPFATGGYFALDDDTYLKSYGGGLNTRMLVTPTVVVDTTFEAVRQDFDNTSKEPTASNQTGYYYTAVPSVIWAATPTTLVTLEGLFGHRDSNEGFESFRELGVVLGATQFFQVPFQWVTDQPWSASLAGAYRNTQYSDPDPLIDPDEKRDDDRYDINVNLQVPLPVEGLFVSTDLQQTWNESNIPNDQFDNTAVTLAVRYAF